MGSFDEKWSIEHIELCTKFSNLKIGQRIFTINQLILLHDDLGPDTK